MNITKLVKIYINNKNITYYKNKGYNVKSFETYEINVEDLPNNCKQLIEVQCDVCGNKKTITYISYYRNINNYGYYACSGECAIGKNKKTSLYTYGTEFPNQNENQKNKIKSTKKERYDDEYYTNIEKQKETVLKTYGVDSYMKTKEFRDKSKMTLLEKYDVEHPQNSSIIREQTKNTNLRIYGFETPLQNEEIKNKIKSTKKERYDDEYFNNREQFRETCTIRYDNENPMQNEDIKEYFRLRFNEKYGVNHPSQVEVFYRKCLESGYKIEKYKDSNIYYQGTYEYDFLNKYYDLIDIERGLTVEYIYNNEKKLYYSDFFIPSLNLIIEIKSNKWYNEHLELNLKKQKTCIEKGYNFLFIIDKDYSIFNKLINYELYKKSHSYQYDIRLNNIKSDLENLKFDHTILKIKDFNFKNVDNNDKFYNKKIKDFIEKYEWLGRMPNRPLYKFVCEYEGILAGVIIMSVPNAYSKYTGELNNNIEILISRGACISWSPKNLASAILSFSMKWVVNNTSYRIFSAYGDKEAKELGTIYQASNFYYLGDKFGSTKLYFDPMNPHRGWSSHRMFRKLSTIKKLLASENIKWDENWNMKTTIIYDKIPSDIIKIIYDKVMEFKKRCLIRNVVSKHKYVYVLGRGKLETRKLRKLFLQYNKIYKYPKER
jgi:hypothetical protein